MRVRLKSASYPAAFTGNCNLHWEHSLYPDMVSTGVLIDRHIMVYRFFHKQQKFFFVGNFHWQDLR